MCPWVSPGQLPWETPWPRPHTAVCSSQQRPVVAWGEQGLLLLAPHFPSPPLSPFPLIAPASF